MTERLPFEGLRVIDFTHVIAGPLATFQLAMMGADVVKIEPPGRGDQLRRMGGEPDRAGDGLGTAFLAINAGKRSLALDLKRPEGREAALGLIDGADVVAENFRPGVMERLGLGADAVRARNPRAVYCSLSGYGRHPDWAWRPAYDHIVQGVAGAMWTQGEEGQPPVKIGFPMADTAAGYAAFTAVCVALIERNATGRGRHVDVSMTAATLAMMATPVHGFLGTGTLPARIGNTAFSGSPASGTYETADAPVVLTANTAAQFAGLCAALGLEGLEGASDPVAWRDPAVDLSHVRRAVAAGLKRKDAAHWERVLNEAGVPTGKVRTVPEALAEACMAERGFVSAVPDPGRPGEEFRLHGTPYAFDGETPAPAGPAPHLGEHSRALLAEAGLGAGEIDALFAEGIAEEMQA